MIGQTIRDLRKQRKKAQKNKPTHKGRLKTLFKFAPIINTFSVFASSSR